MSISVPSIQTHLSHPKYRPDIDGLRAIAILSVLGFHAFPVWISGGFIGVDIFFVISGYLISTIIFGSLSRNAFSFVEFYIRRIKRIFPALLVILLASFAVGWFILLADEYTQLGKHIAGGAGFISNYILWNESGYFDNEAKTKPLLHLWSLGIEEQFYIIWPLLVWSAWKKRLNFLTLAVVVAALSFALNIYEVRSDTVAAFYSPQTRFWELMLGSVLAYVQLYKHHAFVAFQQRLDRWLCAMVHSESPAPTGDTLRHVQSLLGAALIAIGVVFITEKLHFPGWWALLPTVGTVLIIAAGKHAWMNRAVSNRVLVWVGLISYPLYLWHWPLLSFAQIIEGDVPSRAIRITAVALSFALAWLTYHLIEKPIRFGNHRYAKTIALVALMTIVGFIGFTCYAQDNLNFRFIQKGQSDQFDYKSHWIGWDYCNNILANPNHGGCRTLHKDKPIDVLVIGDSHAGHLATGLKEYFQNKKENVAIMNSAGCAPFFPLRTNKKDYFACNGDLIEHALDYAVKTPSVKLVILSGYADHYIYGYRFGRPLSISKERKSQNLNAFNAGLQITLTRLVNAHKKVIYVVDDPEIRKDPRSCVRKIFRKCSIDIPKKAYLERNADFLQLIEENKIKYPQVIFTDTQDIFCDQDYCYGMKGNVLLYASRDHLSPNGSRYLIEGIGKSISTALINH